jgi:hypothetical protein
VQQDAKIQYFLTLISQKYILILSFSRSEIPKSKHDFILLGLLVTRCLQEFVYHKFSFPGTIHSLEANQIELLLTRQCLGLERHVAANI